MIKHILDTSKIESGQVSIKIEKIQLQNLIKQIISSLKPLYSKKKINIKLKGMNKNSLIFADRIKFKQIIYNLLSNALKFTEKGSVILDFKDNSKEWVFEIKDTGIGIAVKDFNLIFKDFKRIKSPYVDSIAGSGLGLALTKRMVNLHEGEITFRSKLGVGTTFTFTIPKIIQDPNKNKKNNN
jgi:signal transduction histidine kinase